MKKHYPLLLALLLSFAFGTQAQVLTVADGTSTNEFISLYGYYMDESQHNQILYPASMLLPMSGNYIGQITWYLQSPSGSPWNSTVTVKLAVVSQTSLSGGLLTPAASELHTVWQGTVNGNTNELLVNFDSPFLYNGGNLLVDITSTPGNWSSAMFYGVSHSGGAYHAFSSYTTTNANQNFLPKATFRYSSTGSFCLAPSSLITTRLSSVDATVAWGGSSSLYGVEYGEHGFTPGSGISTTTAADTLLITGLTAGTSYDVYVWSVCGSENSDSLMYTFSTVSESTVLPYGTGFEMNDDVDWQLIGTTNPWVIGNAVHCGTTGSQALYISSDGGTSNTFNGSSASISYALRPIYVEAGEYVVSFDWRNNGMTSMWGLNMSTAMLYAFLAPTATTSPAALASTAEPGADWIELNDESLGGVTSWQHADLPVMVTTSGNYYLMFFFYNIGYGASAPPAAIDNVQFYSNSCPQPTAVAVGEAASDTIAVHWTPGGSESVWLVRANGGEWEMAYDTTYSIGGLVPNTAYTIDVVALCDGSDTSIATSVQTRTACGRINTFPWTEDFNTFSSGTAAIPCWLSVGGGYYQIVNYSSQSPFVSFRPSGADGGIAVLPEFADVNTLEITFSTAPEGAASGSFSIGYVPESALGTTPLTFQFVALETYPVADWNGSYDFVEKTVSLASVPDSSRIAFKHIPNDGNWYWYLDDIDVHPIPNCQRPMNLELVDVDSNGITISWTDTNSGVPVFVVEWCHSDSAVWHTVTVSDTVATLNGLASGSRYNVRVMTECDGGSLSMPLLGSFNTGCAAITTFPVEENFDAGTVANCWMATDYDGVADDNWQHSNTPYTNHNASPGAFVSQYNGYVNGNNWLVSPAIVLPSELNNITMSWYTYGKSYMGARPYLDVKVSNTSAVDTSAFTTVFSGYLDENEYTRHAVGLSQYAGQTIYVAFVRRGYDDDGLYLDDLSIYAAQEPEVSIVGNATPTVGIAANYAASLDDGSSSGLVYTWSSSRANASTATLTVVDQANITVLYPTAGPDTIRLVAVNSFGADTDYMIVNPIVVDYAAVPYTTGFETGDDVTWTLSNATRNAWYIDTAVSSLGHASMYISSNNGQSNIYDISTVSNSYAYKTFGFNQAGTYGLSFDWHCYGEATSVNIYDYLVVYLAPATANVVGGDSPVTTVPSSWIDLTGRLSANSNWQNYTTFFDIASAGTYKIIFRWYNDSSNGTNPPAAIDNISLVSVSCPAPVSLVIDSVSTNAATFHWSAGDAESTWEVTVGNLPPVVVADTHYTTPATLAPSTFYNVRVRAICGAGDTSLALSGSFTTECVAFAVPFYYDFASPVFNGCWTNVYTMPTPNFAWGADYSNQNDHQIFSTAGAWTSPANDWLITPQIAIPAADTASLELIYYVKGNRDASYTSSQATYEVYVSPNGSADVSAFTDTLFAETIDINVFVRRHFAMSQYAGQNVRVAFCNRSTFYGKITLYEVGVRQSTMPLYQIVGNSPVFTGDVNTYSAVYVEGDTAVLNFTWTSMMAAAGMATMANATTRDMSITYNAAGHDTITLVVANGFGADTLQMAVTVYDCATVTTFPYTEGFNESNPCWTMVYADNNPAVNAMGIANSVNVSVTSMHEGSGAFRFSSFSSTSNYNQYLVSPELNGRNMVVSFWYVKYNSNQSERFRVGYSSTTADTSSFVWGAWVDSADVSNSEWRQFTDSVPNGTRYIAIQYSGHFAYYLFIDDLTITSSGICPAPVITGVVAGETSLTVNWNSSADSVMMTVGTTFTEDGAVTVGGGSYTFTGLSHSTTYTIGLRALCGDGGMSEWTVDTASTVMVDCATPSNLTVQAATYTSATVGWTTTGMETAWEVRAYNTIENHVHTAPTNPYTLTGLTSGMTYTVEVRALCGQNSDIEGAWSAPLTVTTDECQPVTGVNVSDVTAHSAKVNWQPVEVSVGYVVFYGDANFNDQDATTANVSATANTYTMNGLDPESNYEVFVVNRCTEDGVESHPTADDRIPFTTLSSSEGIYDVESGTLTLYPNPASSSVTVTVSGMDGEVTLEIVDLNGKCVRTLRTQSGEVTVDLTTLSQGAYFVRVTGERQTAVRKLIVR